MVLWSCGPVGKAKGGTGENKVLGPGKSGRARAEEKDRSFLEPSNLLFLAPCSSGP